MNNFAGPTTSAWIIAAIAYVVVAEFVGRTALIAISIILVMGALYVDTKQQGTSLLGGTL